jgi:GT2 family glycosyltransferase
MNIMHVHSTQRGRSAGINRGLELVKSRFVAITDDDCFVDENWLTNISNHLREHPDAVVTGRVEAAGEDMILVVTSTIPATYRRPRIKFDSMSGGNMASAIAIFKKVGLFDEDPCLKTAEDAEWSYRALCNGVPITFTPDICVWHFGWRDPSKRAEQYRDYALSHGGFYGKYIRRGDAFIILRVIVHYARTLRRWIRGVWTGNSDLALLGKAYFTWLLPGMIAGFRSTIRPGKLL